MGPKNGKRKRNKEEDDELDKKFKWLEMLQKKTAEASDEEIEEFVESKTFDFTGVKAYYEQKTVVKPPPPPLTPEQLQMIRIRTEKQKAEREQKQKIRQIKRKERKKQNQEQKQKNDEVKRERQAFEKQVEKKIKNEKWKNCNSIPVYLLLLLLLLCIMQYQREINLKLSKFKLDSTVDYYAVFEADSGATDKELKEQYRKLILKYHPDKNPHCKHCFKKFNEVMEAWQILGDPQKRQHYDQNSGYVSAIKSQSITLTQANHDDLLNGDRLWLVQVYDSTEKYCHYFSSFWEDEVQNYKGIISFARIDVWMQTDMLSYIPYSFQLYPGLYTVHKGVKKICQLDYDNPSESMQDCIQNEFNTKLFKKINSPSKLTMNEKQNVIFGGAVKISSRINMIHRKYQDYFNYYLLEDKSTSAVITSTNKTFNFTKQSTIEQYQLYLQTHIVQSKSMCQIMYECENDACIILLEKSVQLNQNMYPVMLVKEMDPFSRKVEKVQQAAGMAEKFDLLIYKGGKIWLGYHDEISLLMDDQEGELLELTCVKTSYLGLAIQTVSSMFTAIFGESET